IRNKQYKKSGLYSLRVKDNLDFKKHAHKPYLTYSDKVGTIVLDCYAKVQLESSKKTLSGEVTKNETTFKPENLAFLDYDSLYFQLQKYKNEKKRYNINILKNDMIALLKN